MNTQAIAQHLNLAEELILEVQEWARVLWVRIKGMRPKFVSKKVAMEPQSDDLVGLLLEAGFTKANLWQKHGLTRIYTQSGFIDLTDKPKVVGGHSKEEKSIALDCVKRWQSGCHPHPQQAKESVNSSSDSDPVVYVSKWSYVGSGRVRTVQHQSGMERYETKGNVLQSDLDDFLG